MSLAKPSIVTAGRSARAQRSWGVTFAWSVVPGTIWALIAQAPAYFWAGVVLSVFGLVRVATAKNRIKLAIAMRASWHQTSRGYRTYTGDPMVSMASMLAAQAAQGDPSAMDLTFDMAMVHLLTEAGY